MGTFGGKQPGAGRPKGAKSKASQEVIERAKAEGIMPLDVLLGDMRMYHQLGQAELAKIIGQPPTPENEGIYKLAASYKAIARECAEKVSPYLHPKLSSIEANVNTTTHEARLAELDD